MAALSAALVLMVLIMAALGGLSYFYMSDWILPGVNAMGVELGHMTTADAAGALRQQWERQTILITDGKSRWTLPPARLGITLDAEAMAKQAHELGRLPENIGQVWETRGRISIDPIWAFDRGTADALLRVMAGQLQIPPQNAGVRVVDGRIETIPAADGRSLDVAATLNWLEAHTWQAVEEKHLRLVVVPVQPAIADIGSALDGAHQMLSAPVPVQLYDPIKDERLSWVITPTVMGNWMVVHGDPASPGQYKWSVDEPKVEAFLSGQSAALGSDRYVQIKELAPEIADSMMSDHGEVRARVYHRPQHHTVTSGETLSSIAFDYGIPYPWIQQANSAISDTVRAGQVITVPSQDLFVPLPVVENKRILVSVSKQRMWAYEDGKVKWEWPASTGIPSSPTNPGIFQIQSHEPNAYAANWDLWMPFFMGIYRPVPTSDFMNGFHGFPLRGGAQILWTEDLGRRVTYGCVLISTENAKTLYEWAQEGVIVTIQP